MNEVPTRAIEAIAAAIEFHGCDRSRLDDVLDAVVDQIGYDLYREFQVSIDRIVCSRLAVSFEFDRQVAR